MLENELSRIAVDAAYRIHTRLGPGLLESVYQALMACELRKAGVEIDVQVPIPVIWDGMTIDLAFRADIIARKRLILELKSVEKIERVHKKQLQTYLKLTNMRLGLLINFNMALIKDGITRVANGLPEEMRPTKTSDELSTVNGSQTKTSDGWDI